MGARLAWFSRITGLKDPVNQTESRSIKPNQTKSNLLWGANNE